MNRNAKRWIKALRSGEYQQTQQRLRNGDGYCCLGVACDLYVQTHKRASWNVRGVFVLGDIEAESELPNKVMNWLGIKSASGRNPATGNSLVDLNDLQYLTFEAIADHIEQYQDVLFEQ